MLWLATSLLALVTVAERPATGAAPVPAVDAHAAAAGTVRACDDGTDAGTLVQRAGAAYGNRFSQDCAAAAVQSVSFVHFGAGNPGPYRYRLRVYDGACALVATTDVLAAGDAVAAPEAVEVDVAALGWCVGSEFALAVEPLGCPTPDDCFPALVVDASSDTHAGAHCAVVVTPADTDPACYAPRSADGRFFDFRLRVVTACHAPGCTTALANPTWSRFKCLYADPTPDR
jgi:hypothetical protein